MAGLVAYLFETHFCQITSSIFFLKHHFLNLTFAQGFQKLLPAYLRCSLEFKTHSGFFSLTSYDYIKYSPFSIRVSF